MTHMTKEMGTFSAIVLIVMPTLHAAFGTTSARCVDSCVDQTNGNYQHCYDCHQYVACSNGHKYIMPCPSNLVWDDVQKRCEWTSPTCNTVMSSSNTTTPGTPPIPHCVDACVGKINGNYQYCHGCHQYVACSNGYKYIMPCPSNLVWDDVKKRCEWTSPTCNIKTPASDLPTQTIGCVDSCVGRINGNYQYCKNCHQYVACSNGYKYIMPCPSNLVWDDVKKICEWTSPTCNISTAENNLTTPNPGCTDSCVNRSNGNFQYCQDCHQYLACSNGYKYVMPCPSNLVWDDLKKRCEWTSSTCNMTNLESNPITTTTPPFAVCVDSCIGQSNGDYQYCYDCHQYVACSNEYMYIMPCPSNLVWDDVRKRCEWTSSTCVATTIETIISPFNSTTGCVDSCPGRGDGNYQYCYDCHQYVACSNEYMYIMPCPSNLLWDDVIKRCEWNSSCKTEASEITTAVPVELTTECVDSCFDQRDGNYQHCYDCHQYVACNNGYMYVMPCPSDLVWDDMAKRCEWTSSTCPATMNAVDTCCIREQMRISLQNKVRIVNRNVPFISILESTTSRFTCNSKILLKATFQKNNLTDSCLGCTKAPQCGNKMLRIDLKMSPFRTNKISFHVGDSRTNNGYRGDAATQQNDAEFHFSEYRHLLYGSDKCLNFSENLTGLLQFGVTRVTVYIGNEFIRVTNDRGYVYELCSRCLFALNGQSDSEGTVNEDIYIGLNRIVDDETYRSGPGVCDAAIRWTCPWN